MITHSPINPRNRHTIASATYKPCESANPRNRSPNIEQEQRLSMNNIFISDSGSDRNEADMDASSDDDYVLPPPMEYY